MNKERLNLLEEYMKIGMSPILVRGVSSDYFDNAIILKSDALNTELNGHYEDVNFCPPLWYLELNKNSSDNYAILLIKDIDKIPLEEQTKFIEILKYKKVSTFELPKNVIVLVTASNGKIHEEVYSLVVEI